MRIIILYYIWVNCCHQQLEDICFEEHLRIPYEWFMQKPITYTWELYIFITLKELTPTQLEKKVCKKISIIYKELIDLYEMQNK